MDDLINAPWQRMDWGFGNPNKTAALLSMLLVAGWAFSHLHKKGFWISLGLFTGLGACLLLTQSRGGLVAAIAGCAVLWAWSPFPYFRIRTVAIAAACVSLFIFAFFIRPESHLTKGASSHDRSIDNRLLIWKQVPSMIRAAPDGWGPGQSGHAYMQWFQPVTRGEGYRTLVNSHLTWLVEWGWLGRSGYLGFWVFIFVILWPARERLWFSIPLAIWATFAVCAVFSSVAETAVLWLIPVVSLMAVLFSRLRSGIWPSMRGWLGGALAAASLLTVLFLCEAFTPDSTIHHEGDRVTLGNRSPHIWVIAPNENILGEHYGHEIRQAFGSSPVLQREGVGVAPALHLVPQKSILVFSGEMPTDFEAMHPAKVIFINPAPASARILETLIAVPQTIIVVGEYSKNREYWVEQAKARHLTLHVVPGAEEYIGTFMTEVSRALIN